MAINSETLASRFTAPSFSLPDVVSGENRSLEELLTASSSDSQDSVGIAIIFLCCHCPYVKHLQQPLIALAKEFMSKGVAFVGISANDAVGYPEDSPESLKEMVGELGIPFPILFDGTQQVAQDYAAACTPEFFLFNGAKELYYHGRFDASTPGNGIAPTGEDFRAALEALCRGEKLPTPHPPAVGCSIKWKA